jgi:hypothetical protein
MPGTSSESIGTGGERLAPEASPHAATNGIPRSEEEEEEWDSLRLVRKELAIYKKLSHRNLVRLYEVLDDSEHNSLFMGRLKMEEILQC